MVSRVVKRTPTKSLRNRSHSHRYSRRDSPFKNATAAANAAASFVVACISTCHRRLLKILARVATMSKRSPRKKGYQILDKSPGEPLDRVLLYNDKFALPPLLSPVKKTVFLDLDETLVHSMAGSPAGRYDFGVRLVLNGEMVELYVLKRPFMDEFLNFLSDRFEIVVFTAGIEAYASLVLDSLDCRNLISHRLYRDSCQQIDGRFVKDLSEIGRELNRAVIVDDNPNSYQFQPDNAIPIKPFVDDLKDQELKKLIHFFEIELLIEPSRAE